MTGTVARAAHLGSAGTNYLVSRLRQLAVFGDIDPDVWNQAVEAATRCERRNQGDDWSSPSRSPTPWQP